MDLPDVDLADWLMGRLPIPPGRMRRRMPHPAKARRRRLPRAPEG